MSGSAVQCPREPTRLRGASYDEVIALIPIPIDIGSLAVRDAFAAEIAITAAQISGWDANGVHHTIEMDAVDAFRFEIRGETNEDPPDGWFVGAEMIEVMRMRHSSS